MQPHEVQPGEVYAWRGADETRTSVRPRRRVLRPVLLVNKERAWKAGALDSFQAFEKRRYPRFNVREEGWLALQTAWSWPLEQVPDDLDRERVEAHVAYLRGLEGLVVSVADRFHASPVRHSRVARGQLPDAPPGFQPAWKTVQADELTPWSLQIEHWGNLAIEPEEWERRR